MEMYVITHYAHHLPDVQCFHAEWTQLAVKILFVFTAGNTLVTLILSHHQVQRSSYSLRVQIEYVIVVSCYFCAIFVRSA